MNTAQHMDAIATGHKESAEAARTILRAGGNAVDATCAAVFMDSLVQPCLIGLAGGGFMVIHDGKKTRVIDMMPRVPRWLAKETPDSFSKKLTPLDVDFAQEGDKPNIQRFWTGRKSVAPPGILPGLVYAKEHYGTDMPWSEIAEPAIALAEAGVTLSPFQGDVVHANLLKEILVGEQADESSVQLFGRGRNEPYRTGDVFKNPDYAAFLRRFTDNPDADALREAYDAAGLHYESLEIRELEPLIINYRGERYETVPAPYPGGLMLSQIFDGIEKQSLTHVGGHVLETETLQGLTNIFRNVFEGYPGLVENLLGSPSAEGEPADRRRSDTGQSPMNADGNQLGNTTHISVYEEHEDAPHAVSLTGSLGETAGIVLEGNPANNLLGEEDLNPLLHPDLRRPVSAGQHLLSRMTPTIRHSANGTVEAIGTGGSTRITTAIAQVLLRRASGEAPHEAIEAPRIHWDQGSGQLRMEVATEVGIAELAQKLGVPVAADPIGIYYGGVHMAGSEGAVGDPRREGSTA